MDPASVRARFLLEREELVQVGADAACFEEAEAAVVLTARVLADLGADEATIARVADRVRHETLGEPLVDVSSAPESPRLDS